MLGGGGRRRNMRGLHAQLALVHAHVCDLACHALRLRCRRIAIQHVRGPVQLQGVSVPLQHRAQHGSMDTKEKHSRGRAGVC